VPEYKISDVTFKGIVKSIQFDVMIAAFEFLYLIISWVFLTSRRTNHAYYI